jgi:hypothetical protein
MDTENREEWYGLSSLWEKKFCDEIAPHHGLCVQINPEKELDPTRPDLLTTLSDGSEVLSELKPQFTPFFKAKSIYKVDPQYAFALNVRDIPDLPQKGIVYFWVRWNITQWTDNNGYTYNVNSMDRVWYAQSKTVCRFIEIEQPPIHHYARRVDDPHNARRSYIFDIRNFTKKEKVNGTNRNGSVRHTGEPTHVDDRQDPFKPVRLSQLGKTQANHR